jgi:rhamnosyltransferase
MSSARPDGHALRPVVIVLSTFDGAAYVGAQIESLQRQSMSDWSLLIRDDGSTDGTVEILRSYAAEDARIRIIDDSMKRLRAPRSFGVLLQAAYDGGAEYVFTCDQDDVWLEHKLEHLLGLMTEREADRGARRPVLVHSDLTVVRDNLSVVSGSFMRLQRIHHTETRALSVLLAQNFVTGCALVVNRPLLRIALPMPAVLMHDWWLAQVASACGSLVYSPEPTVLYRQHASNVVGARGYWGLVSRAVLDLPRWWQGRLDAFRQALDQADELVQRVREEPGSQSREAVELIDSYRAVFTSRKTTLGRVREVRRIGVHPQNRFRRLAFYARVAALSGSRVAR